MSNILIRLIVVKNNKEYNVLFDSNFSISDNMKVLENMIDEKFNTYYVYDNKLNIFLDKSITLESYNIPPSRTFYIY